MSRYPLPQGGQGVNPQQIVNAAANNAPQQVVLQNVGAANIYFSESYAALANRDSSGNPTGGFILLPNTPPVTIDTVTGPLYAYSPGGSLLECTVWPVC